jgi:small GTP-binding protein
VVLLNLRSRICDQKTMTNSKRSRSAISGGKSTNVWLTLWCFSLFLVACSGFSLSRIPTKRSTIDNLHQTEAEADTKETSDKENESKKESIKELVGIVEYEGRMPMRENFRCGFVSILGAPNMGKSTLLNALLKEDLCVATRRPQTTRHAILGVLTTSDCQLCLVDTPGIIDTPAYKLQEGMMEAVMGAFHDSDVLMVVTDLFSTPIPDDEIFDKVRRSRKPTIVVINKIDLEGKANRNSDENKEEGRTVRVVDAVAKWRSLLPEALAILPVAASEGIDNPGIVALRKLLLGGDDLPSSIRDMGRPVPGMFRSEVNSLTDEDAKALLPEGPPLYDEEIMTDRPERCVENRPQ